MSGESLRSVAVVGFSRVHVHSAESWLNGNEDAPCSSPSSAARGAQVSVGRGLVTEAGQDPATTATLYRTTSYFLERIGLTSVDDLPELAPFLPEMGDLDDYDEQPRVAVAPAAEPAEQGTA